jgi:hypothetical protein
VSQKDVIQSHLEVLMEKHLETDELKVACDGEIRVSCQSGAYTARVKTYAHAEPHIEIYSVMVEGVDADPGLFEAINEFNRGLSHARVFWMDRQVVVVGEMLGVTADEADVDCVCQEIGSFVHAEGPKLAATFGGSVAFPDQIEGES